MSNTGESAHASEIDPYFDHLTPEDMKDAVHHRTIIAVDKQIERLTGELNQAVADARAAGETWAEIGMALGMPGEAAREKFTRHL